MNVGACGLEKIKIKSKCFKRLESAIMSMNHKDSQISMSVLPPKHRVEQSAVTLMENFY